MSEIPWIKSSLFQPRSSSRPIAQSPFATAETAVAVFKGTCQPTDSHTMHTQYHCWPKRYLAHNGAQMRNPSSEGNVRLTWPASQLSGTATMLARSLRYCADEAADWTAVCNSWFRLAPARNEALLERSGGILSQGSGLRLAGGSNQSVEHLALPRIEHLFSPLRRKDVAETVRLLNERGQPGGQGA